MSMPEPSVETGTVGATNIDFTRLIYMLFTDLESQIGRMDFKASLVITANSILLLVTANMLAFIASPQPLASKQMVVTLVALLPSLILSCLALRSALSVITPRMPPPLDTTSVKPSYFFSGHIAALNIDDYLNGFMALSLDTVKKQVIASVHAKATVLHTKIGFVRRGIQFTLVSFAIWLPCIGMIVWLGRK